MSTRPPIDTRVLTFQEMIGNGRTYRVPRFQRDYSWGEEQWEDLWNDLAEMTSNPGERHYLGAVVFEPISDRELSVIDGQQRLATLSILSLAAISRLLDLVTAGVDPEANQARAAELRNSYIGRRDPASLVESSRLILNEANDDFFQTYLVQLRSPFNESSLSHSNRLLWRCYEYFRARIAGDPNLVDDGSAIAALISESAARRLLFLELRVEAELNAYTVFETLNARGLDLSTTDLLKNYLFSLMKVESDELHVQRRWRELMGLVRPEDFPSFLRYHFLCEMPRVRGDRLFKILRSRVQTPGDVRGLLGDLEPRAELFTALQEPDHPLWIAHPEARDGIRRLRLFDVPQFTPLLLTAWDRLTPGEFVRVLHEVLLVLFRFSVIGGRNTNLLEPVAHRAAQALITGEARTPSQVFRVLSEAYVDDQRFRAEFALFSVDSSQKRKRIARYILAELEADASGRSVNPETDPGTIEHILPESPDESWVEAFPREQWDAARHRLGNLTLLEAPLNRRVGNADFTRKLAVYVESGYALTRAIPENYPEEWSWARMEKRQQDLARRAAHRWRVDHR